MTDNEKENNSDTISLTKVEINNKANLVNSPKFQQSQKKSGMPPMDINQMKMNGMPKLDLSQMSKMNGMHKMDIAQMTKLAGMPKMPMMPKNMNGANIMEKSPCDFQVR